MRLFSCTPTKLLTWVDCPRRYRFSYLDRPPPPKGPPWAHNSVGASVHLALARWWDLPLAERTPAAGARLVGAAWVADGFRDGEQSAAAGARAADWVARYLSDVDPAAEPIGVERTVAAPTERLAVSGRVDRIDSTPDGELVVIDYKTGRRAPDPDDAANSLALALYAVAAARTMRRPCHRAELHHLPSGGRVSVDFSPDRLRRRVAEAESIAQDAARAEARFRALTSAVATAPDLATGHEPTSAAAAAAPDLATGHEPTSAAAGPRLAAGREPALADQLDRAFPAVASRLCSWCDFRAACPQGREAAEDLPPWAGLEPLSTRDHLADTAH